uniref:C2H2-type domain-containing protein n=1 Tax=Periophthalmus magnuspinnatus TaxID=409849 RepID=A0A3B4A488_9GOBI
MLGLQGNASSSKEYRCVACSATFTGLASLLVHQATHAGSLPKPPSNPSGSNLYPSTPMYICDCGEEFKDFSVMIEHKQTHESEVLSPQLLVNHGQTSNKDYRCVACSATFTGLASLLVHQATHAGSLPKPPSNPSATQMYICDCGEEFKDFSIMFEHKQTHVAKVSSSELMVNNGQTSNKDISKTQCSPTGAQTNEALEEDSAPGPSEDELCSFKNTVDQEEPADTSTKDHSPVSAEAELEKELAAQDMPEETEGNEMDEPEPKHKSLMKILASTYGKHLVPPQSEDDDKVMASLKEKPELVVIAPQTTTKGPSAMQLKRLLGKPCMKTKAPSISRLLESSTKKIVSLTKIFSPVVLLETRHKFMDPSSNNVYGKYQCARCRRVFQDVDSLTEHHFLHKKERIKCCRCCKQLIIGRVPLPDNHICPQSRPKTTTPSYFKSIATSGQKTIQIDSVKNVYFCPICKQNFTRRYNLKKHKCRGSAPSPPPQTKFLSSATEACLNVYDEGNISLSIGVGTRSIKIEDTSDPEYEKELSNLSWSSASSIKDQHKNASAFAASFLQEQDSQWTLPLDNEQKTLTSSEKKRRTRVSFFFKNGVRRYPCNKCHQTFGLTGNLSRHRKVCGINPKGFGSGHNSNSAPVNSNNVKMYSCYVCGRNFNRKDNMMVHRKKCEMRRTMIPNFASEINPSLPLSNAPQDLPQEDDGGNWSIMSLPSVLPRRVTCECGIGFTSPKLLLEHLQKHAQESYTCPTCGVTVNSWADYEIHLQLHMHPQHHRHLNPLLLQLKTNVPLQQPATIGLFEKAPQTQKEFKLPNKKQMFACPRCGSTFARRCSLRRHLTWSQGCKKEQKNFQCAECSTVFLTVEKLRSHKCSYSDDILFHCPICRQEFKHRPSMHRHILSHSHEKFQCSECDQTFPNPTALGAHQFGAGHGVLKPYECPDCGMVFKHYSVMEEHRLKHAESSCLYQCKVCGKSFKYSSLLHQHQYLHTGRKPFCCSECGRTFAFAQNLKAHCRQHSLGIIPTTTEKTSRSPKEPLKWNKAHNCPHCHNIYSDELSLKVHISSVHKSDSLNNMPVLPSKTIFATKCPVDFLTDKKLCLCLFK